MTQLFSALFLDYDNVVSELGRESHVTATRFATQPGRWLEAIRGDLPLYPDLEEDGRRIVARRCYASPFRINRNREDFTRAGFEVIDCPPLTARLKNSADICMVIDIIDYMQRYPRIAEFVILSADADFTPLLHRLRRELKRTVIFSAYNTASAYRNCSDQQLSPAFFSDILNVTTPATRPSETPVEAIAVSAPAVAASAPMEVVPAPPAEPQPAIAAELAAAMETVLHDTARCRQGLLTFTVAASVLDAKFSEPLAGNWAGFRRFTTFLRALPLSSLRVDWDRQVIVVPNFSPDLSTWSAEDRDALSEFLTDVLQIYNVPLFTPAEYTAILQMLREYWMGEDGTIVGAIRAVQARCDARGVKATQAGLRFIVTGISQHGVEFSAATTVEDMANALRLHVFQVCDEPEWMLDREEVARLVYWIRAENEGDEAVDAFLAQVSAYEAGSEAARPDEAVVV